MKKWKKILLITAGSCFLLAIGSAIALRFAYPPERVKKILLEELSKRLNREVSFGEVSVGILKGISIGRFQCSEKPNFQAGTFLECEKFSIRVSLLSLLEKKFEISNIELQSPRIRISRFEDGKTYNFSDLLSTAAVKPELQAQKPEAVPAPLLVSLSQVKIINGEFALADTSPQKLDLSVRSLNLTTQGSSPQRPIKIRLEADLKAQSASGKQSIEGSLNFDGHVFVNQQRIKIDQFLWKTANVIQLDVKGSIENFTNPKIDTELNIPEVDIPAFLKTTFGSSDPLQNRKLDGKCKLQLKTKGEFALSQMLTDKIREGSLNFSLSADMKDLDFNLQRYFHKTKGEIFNLDITGEWKSSKTSQEVIHLSQLAVLFKNFKMDSAVRYQTGKELEVSKCTVVVQNASVEASGKISKINTALPDFSVTAKSKQFPLSSFSELIQKQIPAGSQLSGTMDFTSSLSGNLSDLSAKLDLDAGQAVIKIPKSIQKEQGIPLSVSFSGTLKNKKSVDLNNLKIVFQKSNLEASGKIFSFAPPSPAVDLTIQSSSLLWQDVLGLAALPPDCSVTGSSDKIAVHVLGTKNKFRTNGEIDLQNTGIVYGAETQRNFKKSAGIPMTFKFQGTWESPDTLNLESFNLLLQKTNFLGKANLSKFLSPKKTFIVKLDTDRIPLKEFSGYLPLLNPYSLDGTMQTNFMISGVYPLDTFPKASGWIEIKNVYTKLGELPVKDVNAKLTFTENSYNLPGMTGKIADIPFQFLFSLVNPVSPAIRMEANLGVINLSALKPVSPAGKPAQSEAKSAPETANPSAKAETPIPFHFPASKVSGKIMVKKLVHSNFDLAYITLEYDLSNVTPQLDKVSGKAKMRTFGGEVMNVGAVEKILKIINPSLSILDFKKVGADLAFSNGTMTFKDLWIESEKLVIGGEGTVYLPNRKSDINILARYSAAALAASVLVSITGDLASPQIERKNVSVLSQTLREKVFRMQTTETK